MQASQISRYKSTADSVMKTW